METEKKNREKNATDLEERGKPKQTNNKKQKKKEKYFKDCK